MTSIPTVQIAMFGARSTGKTNLLASFCGADAVQGCSIDLNDPETRKVLSANWKRLQLGDVPSATAMTDEKPLTFRLCQKVVDETVDEFGWNVVIKDYAGRLVEDEMNIDAITEEVKAQLDRYIQGADAILFLVPVEIRGWSISEQESYVLYIKTCISIAKSARERGRSIPFCFALMKWDVTGIDVSPAVVNISGSQSIPEEVSQFLENNAIFKRIHTVISDLSNEDVAIFATSSYGAHDPNDNKLPDPTRLRPFNIVQMLHWICANVESVRLKILRLEISHLTSANMDENGYCEIDYLFQTFLNSGVNDPKIRKQIEEKREENRVAHSQFYDTSLQDAFEIIDSDRRCRNPFEEKAKWLQNKLNRILYQPEEERELRHDLKDMLAKAEKRRQVLLAKKVGWYTLGSILAIVIACSVGMFFWVSSLATSYTNGEAIIAKDEKNLTFQDFCTAKPFFDIPPCPFENYIPLLEGRREAFYERYRVVEYAEKTARLKVYIAQLKGATLTKKLKEIHKIESDLDRMYFHEPELSLFKEIDLEKQNALQEIPELMNQELADLQYSDVSEDDIVQYRNVALKRIEVYTRFSQYYPEKSEFAATRESLEKTAQKERDFISNYLNEKFKSEIAELGIPETFGEKQKYQEECQKLYLKYADYCKDIPALKANYIKEAENAKTTANDLQKYVLLEREVQATRDLSGLERQKKATDVLAKFPQKEYPLAVKLLTEIRELLEQGYKDMLDNLKSRCETDSPDDPLPDRIANTQKRLEIYNTEIVEYDAKNQKEIQSWIDRDELLIQKLDEWQILEELYNEVKAYYESDRGTQVKLDKCVDYLTKTAKPVYFTYSKYEEWQRNVTLWQKILKSNLSAEDWLDKFDKFYSGYEESIEETIENNSTIVGLMHNIPIATDEMDSSLKTKLENAKIQLENIRVKNIAYAEGKASQKIKETLSTLKANPDANNLNIAIAATIDYLQNPLLEQRRESVNSLKLLLEDIQKPRQLRVSVLAYDVQGTYFNNFVYDNRLTFSFSTRNDSCTISHVGDGTGRYVGSGSLITSCNTYMTIVLNNTAPDRDKDDDSLSLLHAVFSPKEYYEAIFYDRFGAPAAVLFSIDNLPACPNF